MRKALLLSLCLPLFAAAQPAGYYNTAMGKSGEPLRQALAAIIRPHTQLTYTPGLWNAYYTTDVKPNGKLWDIYSDIPGGTPFHEFTLGTEQCSGSSPSAEGGCYNREHIWPQSKFSSQYPMESDLWIVYPTDYYVNSKRGDLPYGKVVTPITYTFKNGSKIGANSFTGAPSGSAFEPIDSFKGDIARSYFYITTCYLGDSATFQDWEMALKSTLKPWAIQMLLQWHHMDPVSRKERDRNQAAYVLQGNRNPFIDFPQFADCIWGGTCAGLSAPGLAEVSRHIQVYPNPAVNRVIIQWEELAPDEVIAVDVLNVQGQVLYHAPGNTARAELLIPVADWAKGLYLVEIKTRHGVQAQKVTVE